MLLGKLLGSAIMGEGGTTGEGVGEGKDRPAPGRDTFIRGIAARQGLVGNAVVVG